MAALDWPVEQARLDSLVPRWSQPASNLCLDFHGDPVRARLVVFSDGNHHMALAETLQAFVREHPGVGDVFYATTPPSALLSLLSSGCLDLGNLRLCVTPHVFISPGPVLDRVVATGRMVAHQPFMRSRGNVLLVRHGNPKAVHGVTDLARSDVRLFLSNPKTETASYEVYADTLRGLAQRDGIAGDFLGRLRAVHGERIHHREAPQALTDDRADAAVLYYHLALRYTRIFPDRFEIVPLDDAPDDRAAPENVMTHYRVGLVDAGGEWGGRLLGFLAGKEAADIYCRHGLQRAE